MPETIKDKPQKSWNKDHSSNTIEAQMRISDIADKTSKRSYNTQKTIKASQRKSRL